MRTPAQKLVDVHDYTDPYNRTKQQIYVNAQGTLRFRCMVASGDVIGILEYGQADKLLLKLPEDYTAIDIGVSNVQYNEEKY